MSVERTEVHSINRGNLTAEGLHDKTCHCVADISAVILVPASLTVSPCPLSAFVVALK